MKCKLIACLIFLTSLLQAHPNQYLYDQNKQPIFVKVPIHHILIKELKPLVDFPILIDETGPFFASMVLFKHWICPYCGILNPVETSDCIGQNCPNFRKT